MEEDEEVDIVGGFDDCMSRSEREISNLSSGQILSCDYTVHPRWLSDNNDGTELWPENLPKQSSQDEMEMVQDEVVIEEPAPIDFNWVEETEEASNCGDIILEQDIPASLEEEVVTNSGTEAEYDDHSDAFNTTPQKKRVQRRPNTLSASSVEDGVSGGPLSPPQRFMSINPRSLLKRHYFDVNEQLSISCQSQQPQVKFKQTLLVNKNVLKANQAHYGHDQMKSILKTKSVISSASAPLGVGSKPAVSLKLKKPTTKFKKSLTLMDRNVPENDNFQAVLRKLKQRKAAPKEKKQKKYGRKDSSGPSTESLAGKTGKRGGKKFVDLHGENITINHEADTIQGPTKRETADEEKIVIVKRESDSDIEVDIESETDELPAIQESPPSIRIKTPPILIKDEVGQHPRIRHTPEYPDSFQLKDTGNSELDEMLSSAALPTESIRLSPQSVTDLEKYFHHEFFEGRPTKTPERFMKIRAYILNAWNENKPSYVSKTTVRSGLKHCGDVNCISRIHSLLEQIGAINFGHAGEHFDYIRPLWKLKEYFMQPARNKQSGKSENGLYFNSLVLERKQRNKCAPATQTKEAASNIDANYTVSHMNGVTTVVIASTAPDKESNNPLKVKTIKPELELIECMRFTKDKMAPFKVTISLSTLLCLQLHSLSSKCEVMGFLGGFCTKSVNRNKLSITRYKPCNTSEQSGTMCEMCPVSQVEQSNSLIAEGYDLLGWFHSHPLFEPNPSHTDVRTQAEMQQQFSLETDRPFIGLIMGCIDMKYNCMYVMPRDLRHLSPDTIPYSLEVDIIKDCSNLKNEIDDILSVIDKNSDSYVEAVQKFSSTAQTLLQQYGYTADILNGYL